MLTEALAAGGRADDAVRSRMVAEAERIGFDERFLTRPLNVDLSGGEKKRNETLQLGVLRPRIAILDEVDSGLDVDALRDVSRRIEQATNEDGLGVLAITHYSRLFHELRPDRVHVLVNGRIEASGGPEVADELEATGYEAYRAAGEAATETAVTIGPFADPLA
jgi:Fe-S cluster assembly ATP-binding protein